MMRDSNHNGVGPLILTTIFWFIVLAFLTLIATQFMGCNQAAKRVEPCRIIVFDRETNHLLFYHETKGWIRAVDAALVGELPEAAISTGKSYPTVERVGFIPSR
jgi:hypothetical protein